MDKKFSDFGVATTLLSTDYIPILSAGNKKISGGVFSLNLPNMGNRGITKNVVTQASTSNIPLTVTNIKLPLSVNAYVLADGSDGQEMMLASLDINTVNITNGFTASINMSADSTITLVFLTDKWYAKSYHNVTFI